MASSCALAVILGVGLGGCVGYIINTGFAWRDRTTNVKTKPEVLARFGEPLRTAEGPDGETWYYHASQSLSGGPPPTAANLVFLIIVPIS